MFDVASLFTNVSIDLVLHAARECLEVDSSLNECTNPSVDNIMELLISCLNATYFTFQGVHTNRFSVPTMGFSVSIVVVMENEEERALGDFPTTDFGSCMLMTYVQLFPAHRWTHFCPT